MISNNPVGDYDKLSVNLAVTSFYKTDGSRDMNIALRVIPTKVNDGTVTTLDDQAYTVYRGSLNELKDVPEQECLGKIIVVLQEFINNRGW